MKKVKKPSTKPTKKGSKKPSTKITKKPSTKITKKPRKKPTKKGTTKPRRSYKNALYDAKFVVRMYEKRRKTVETESIKVGKSMNTLINDILDAYFSKKKSTHQLIKEIHEKVKAGDK